MKKNLLLALSLILLFSAKTPAFLSDTINVDEQMMKNYKHVTEDVNVIKALEMMSRTSGDYSKNAILGKNLTGKPIKIEFTNLGSINPIYTNFDALGWKKKKTLTIYINQKHKDAPPEALAALLSHEAIHQDEENSINEETYAWTLEAAVWTQLAEDDPNLEKISHPLVDRENAIKTLFLRGNRTSEYIHKFVITNRGYQNLPERSVGFEELL